MSARAFAIACVIIAVPSAQERAAIRPITWDDVGPVRARLEADGVTQATFAAYVKQLQQTNARRVHEGDLDHLVFYLLQSTTIAKLEPIEPALSAKAYAQMGAIPAAVVARTRAFLRAIDGGGGDARLAYFRELAGAAFPDRDAREAAVLREYARVMKFVYEKEFVAQRSEKRQEAIAELYRTRGLSTDTAVEAGFLVADGLAVLRALDPSLHIRRVLIVGPGLDLAPRTGLLDARAPESYQPWAVIDALLALGLSRADDLEVTGADINPRVVGHIRRTRDKPPTLTLISDIRETQAVSLSNEFRTYFSGLGRHLGNEQPGLPAEARSAKAGYLSKTVRVQPRVARVLRAETLDVVTQRLASTTFDLVIATNILPYFDDVALMLAMSNVAGMLAPGGVFLHNEARPLMHEVTAALGMPVEQSRQAIIASVKGGAAPLFDSVWLHRKAVR